MNSFLPALWTEGLKARRSKMSFLTSAGFLILPLIDGLFMIILKDPEQARAMGLISVKAQLTAGVADWPTFFGILAQGTAVGGGILFALITAWVFGREFSDHTAKELLALPTQRGTIVAAKFVLIGLWVLGLTLMIYGVGLVIGLVVDIPGGSLALAGSAFWYLLFIALLTSLLMPFVALFASAGGGYLPALGWAIFTTVLAQVAAVLGWGDWVPWAVPALLSGMAGTRADPVGPHSYILVLLTCIAGAVATFVWWRRADQA